MKSCTRRRSMEDSITSLDQKDEDITPITRSFSHDSHLFIYCDKGLFHSCHTERSYDSLLPDVWREDFRMLVSSITAHSENLESFSTELLHTEGKIRQLKLLQKAISEYFDEREDQYYQKLTECQEAAKQQLVLIENLMELNQDLQMTKSAKKQQESFESARKNCTTTSLSSVDSRQWHFGNNIQDLMNLKSLEETLNTLRWEVGLWIGGGVGTGHIIHSFENPSQGVEMMVAGSGTLTSSDSSTITPRYQNQHTQENSSSSSIHFIHHQYIFHITPKDRKTKLALLSKKNWVPDHATNTCQFQNHAGPCKIQFSLFQRRHHCRKCGLIICQRHSLNRLPLFSNRHDNVIWHRVCDACFHDLIQ